MYPSDTLKVRNLPPTLAESDIVELLRHFGATEVKCIGTKNITAFAKFETCEASSSSLRKLHQLDVMGYLLKVEYAKSNIKFNESEATNISASFEKDDNCKKYEKFLQRLNAWSLNLNLSQPPPAHLRYQYPPPSVEVLANIARALAAVPKFYTQVLHLMNKMNLPSPFHETSDEYRMAMSQLLGPQSAPLKSTHLIAQESENIQEENIEAEEMQLSSTSESELESDGESQPATIIPSKRNLRQAKKIKRPRFMRPAAPISQSTSKALQVEEVFEVAERGAPKNLSLKLISTTEKFPSTEEKSSVEKEGFGILFPQIPEKQTESAEPIVSKDLDGSFITVEELRANKVPDRDQKVLPVFMNYQAGAPTCRLYIKNLSKNVTERDLHYIYRCFLGTSPTDEENNKMFDIRLMTEGRMKGQAFVTLPTVAQAQRALRETLGYILKDKPMVVQFARSAKPKAN